MPEAETGESGATVATVTFAAVNCGFAQVLLPSDEKE